MFIRLCDMAHRLLISAAIAFLFEIIEIPFIPRGVCVFIGFVLLILVLLCIVGMAVLEIRGQDGH